MTIVLGDMPMLIMSLADMKIPPKHLFICQCACLYGPLDVKKRLMLSADHLARRSAPWSITV